MWLRTVSTLFACAPTNGLSSWIKHWQIVWFWRVWLIAVVPPNWLIHMMKVLGLIFNFIIKISLQLPPKYYIVSALESVHISWTNTDETVLNYNEIEWWLLITAWTALMMCKDCMSEDEIQGWDTTDSWPLVLLVLAAVVGCTLWQLKHSLYWWPMLRTGHILSVYAMH